VRDAAPAVTRTMAILGYHKAGRPPDGSSSWFYVDEEVFAEQLRYLRREGWQPLDAATVVAGLERPELVPPKAVVITFDDGYRSNLTVAAPILLEAGFPASCSWPPISSAASTTSIAVSNPPN
jgi:biofilm PGA synthesis lipoprotein PgaB